MSSAQGGATSADAYDRPSVDATNSPSVSPTDASPASAPHAKARQADAEPPPPPRKRVFFFVLLLVGGLVGYGAFKHWQTSQAADETQHEAETFVPEVQTITAEVDGSPRQLTLPGQTEPFDTSTIWPRATGYVVERHVDIGSRVKSGELLIRIASPDVDRQDRKSVV